MGKDAILHCPYCNFGRKYLKGSVLSKELARTGVYQNVQEQHIGRAVYARMTTTRVEL